MTGHHTHDAAETLREALRTHRDTGDQPGQATVLTFLGVTLLAASDHQNAVGELEEALDIYRTIGDQDGEAMALNQAGTWQQASGDDSRAAGCHRQALALRIASPWEEAHALAGLGHCAQADGHTADAPPG
ncbi:tetratricopeptide repeat protein [Frankia sp. CiP3]|uniref:tetratricopeptide repeat protein n=1 Tax=Frankia sp. CiP3 TaxID=2880971 RepID=UPI001EF62D32|nr:tetratricopeptide repeat protein [Frankia sp. CiP3]